MIQVNKSLTTSLRFFYNNRNTWRRYNKSIPNPTEPVQLQKEFQVGDKPEVLYKNKLIFPKEYRPEDWDIEPMFFIGIVLTCFYLNWRYERKRELNGRTFTTEYVIWSATITMILDKSILLI